MRIVLLTAGSGSYHCGTCMRDNALVNALRELGHDAVLVPMYLPMMLDEKQATPEAPLFFGGINVYLQQVSGFFRRTPRWIDRFLDTPRALASAAKRVGMTRPSELGGLTISMLQGENGKQAKEVERLIAWLKTERPEVVVLSNGLLLGVARRIKREVRASVICTFQGEDSFLDSLPEPDRTNAWKTLEERALDCDSFISVSRYYADVILSRIKIPADRMHVVHNGIDLAGYAARESAPDPPVLGFLAHLTPVKGLETLIDSYVLLRSRGRIRNLQLRIAGSANAADQTFIRRMRDKIDAAGLAEEVQFRTNLDRAEKIEFLRGLSILSVPATYGEAFGLYLLEAWAAGVPVVQPRSGAFPELLQLTGGGLLCEPDNPKSLADFIEELLGDPDAANRMGASGKAAVLDRFSVQSMAQNVVVVLESTISTGHKQESIIIDSRSG